MENLRNIIKKIIREKNEKLGSLGEEIKRQLEKKEKREKDYIPKNFRGWDHK